MRNLALFEVTKWCLLTAIITGVCGLPVVSDQPTEDCPPPEQVKLPIDLTNSVAGIEHQSPFDLTKNPFIYHTSWSVTGPASIKTSSFICVGRYRQFARYIPVERSPPAA